MEEQYIDSEISSLLDTKGVAVTPISKFCDETPVNGFVLGLGTFKEEELERIKLTWVLIEVWKPKLPYIKLIKSV